MLRRPRLTLVALVATTALAGTVGTATARNLSVSNQNFRIVWAPMTVRGTAAGECNVTMEGSFHTRSLIKVESNLIGYITRATREACGANLLYVLNGTEEIAGTPGGQTLPWHVRFDSFAGTLPNIVGVTVRITNLSFLILGGGLICLYKSEAFAPAVGTISVVSGEQLLNFRWKEERRIPLFNGMLCAPTAELRGTGTVTLLGNATTIFIRLI
jgi:hypothetical protein